jgi:hypothetical protein
MIEGIKEIGEDSYNSEIEELVLLLLYLTGWEEKIRGFDKSKTKVADKKLIRSWKGYPFEILDVLQEKGYISQGKYKSRSKSVVLTESGIEKAKQLKKKYSSKDITGH